MSAILAGVNAIPADPLRAGDYVAPDNASIAAVKAKTDALTISAGAVDANIKAVNGQVITGTGAESDPWGP
jgi:hypothetical protein